MPDDAPQWCRPRANNRPRPRPRCRILVRSRAIVTRPTAERASRKEGSNGCATRSWRKPKLLMARAAAPILSGLRAATSTICKRSNCGAPGKVASKSSSPFGQRIRGSLFVRQNRQHERTHRFGIVPQLYIKNRTIGPRHAERGIHKTYGHRRGVRELRIRGHRINQEEV